MASHISNVANPATKRILKELATMHKEPPPNISASHVDDNDLYIWQAIIVGPAGSVYEGGVFKLSIIFPADYPFKAPRIEFITKIYHCNILNKILCIDILKNQWSPALTIDKVLISILSLLMDPNPDDPMNREAGVLFNSNRDKYNETAREWTRKYATDSSFQNE